MIVLELVEVLVDVVIELELDVVVALKLDVLVVLELVVDDEVTVDVLVELELLVELLVRVKVLVLDIELLLVVVDDDDELELDVLVARHSSNRSKKVQRPSYIPTDCFTSATSPVTSEQAKESASCTNAVHLGASCLQNSAHSSTGTAVAVTRYSNLPSALNPLRPTA